MKLLAWFVALLSGALVTTQTGSNARLKKSLDEPLLALLVNYLVGISAAGVYAAAKRVSLPSLDQAGRAPWWAWVGGLFGAIYGLTAIVLANQMGAATLTALVVTGQLVFSVTVDHFGWIGFDVHPASWARIAGCVLMIIGLLLIAKY